MRIEEGFLQTSVDLGHIFAGKNYTAKFTCRNIIKVDKVEASCDCLSIENEVKKEGRILVQYKPRFPKHLEERGDKQYDSQKSVKIFYRVKSDNGEQQQFALLLITAKVMK